MNVPQSSNIAVPPDFAIGGPTVSTDVAGAEPVRAEKRPSLKSQAVRGSIWSGITLGMSQVLRLGSNIILARLLFPDVFGLSTLAMSISKGLNMFTDIGLGPNIIQSPNGDEPKFLNTAWTVQLVRALGLALILAVIAFPVARAYGEPRLFPILLALAAGALLNGSASTSLFTMNRHMEIGRMSMLNIGEQVASLLVTIGVAWVYPSVWAVVIGWFGGGVFRVVSSHFYNRNSPNRFCWDADALQSLVRFGRWIFVSTAILFLANQLDRLMLGRLAPMAQLGVYGMALSMASLPQQICSRITSFVLYPVLAKQAKEERPIFARKVLKARRSVLTAALVMMLGVALVSPAFFRFFYDARYQDAIWMAPLLCIYVWFSVLQSSADRALLALGDTRALAASNAVNVVVTIVGCLVGYRMMGMLGFILGLSFSSLASHLVIQWSLSRKGIGLLLQDLRFTLLGLAAGAIGLIGIRLIEKALGSHSHWALVSPVVILSGASLWAFLVLRGEIFKKRAPVVAAAAPIAADAVKFTSRPVASLSKLQVVELVQGWQTQKYSATVLRSRPDDDRIVIRLADTAYGSVILKLWKRPGLKGFLRRLSRTASVFREWRMCRHLQSAGIAAPLVLGYAMLGRSEWPYTEALITQDLGELTSGPARVKLLLVERKLPELAHFESQLIELTASMIKNRVLDPDHSIANVALDGGGQLIRLDFELARSVLTPRMHPKLFGLMLGRLVVSYAFQVQPDVARAEQFARQLVERVHASPRIMAHATRFIDSRLERQRTRHNIDLNLQLKW